MSETTPPDHPQPKRASDMTAAERTFALAELRKGAKPEPMPVDVKAADMTEAARKRWLAEHIRRTR
jgi:hypothetical protein